MCFTSFTWPYCYDILWFTHPLGWILARLSLLDLIEDFDFSFQLQNVQKTINIISVESKFTDTLIVAKIIKIKSREFQYDVSTFLIY